MNPHSALYLAFRFLFGPTTDQTYRRIRGGVIGVGLSLIPIVVVLQVADGMIAGISERYFETGSSHIVAVAQFTPEPESLEGSVSDLERVAGVELVAREKRGLGLAAFGDGRTAVTIRAVEPDLWERDPSVSEYIDLVAGEWDLSERSVLLGESVASELGATVGDTVRILTARTLSGGRIVPRTRSVTVTGVFSSGYADLDRLWVFLPFDEGARILPDETSETLIGIKIADPLSLPNPLFRASSREAAESAVAIVDEVRELLTPDYRVTTWFESDRATYMSFRTTKDLLVFITVLIVIVAAVNISSALVMLVLEKQEEIAVLKSFGASPSLLVFTFVLAGMVLGALGTLVGLALGLLLAVNINEVLWFIEVVVNAFAWLGGAVAGLFADVNVTGIEILSSEYYLQEIPTRIRLVDLMLVSILTIFLASLAAWFPARRAGRVRPLDVLRRH